MFAVEYSNGHPWKRYDTHATRENAEKTARFLRSQGNNVRVVPCDPPPTDEPAHTAAASECAP